MIKLEAMIADHNYHEPLSITNSFGVPSFEPEFWKKDLADLVKNTRKGQIVVGGFQGTKEGDGNVEAYIEDYRNAARHLIETHGQVTSTSHGDRGSETKRNAQRNYRQVRRNCRRA